MVLVARLWAALLLLAADRRAQCVRGGLDVALPDLWQRPSARVGHPVWIEACGRRIAGSLLLVSVAAGALGDERLSALLAAPSGSWVPRQQPSRCSTGSRSGRRPGLV